MSSDASSIGTLSVSSVGASSVGVSSVGASSVGASSVGASSVGSSFASTVLSSGASVDPHATPPAAALTTVFTPTAAYCTTGISKWDTGICMPPNWSAYWTGDVGYYSPGICPRGYTSACPRTSSGTSYGPPLLPSETAIICCPGYYACDPNYLSRCTSFLSSDTTLTVVYGTDSYTETRSYSVAYAIQVRWQATDLVNLETNPAKQTQFSQTAFYTSTSTTFSTPTITPLPSPGLSTGAKIGIGVAIPLVFLIALFIGICLFLRRKRKRRGQIHSHDMIQEVPHSTGGPMAVATDAAYQAPPHYMPSEKPELESTTLPVNQGNRDFSELAANYMPSDKPVVVSPNVPAKENNRGVPELANINSEVPELAEKRGGVPELANNSPDPTFASATELPAHTHLAQTEQSPSGTDEMRRLEEEQARLQERRRRLLMLEQIDDEEQRLRHQMAQVKSGGSNVPKDPEELEA